MVKCKTYIWTIGGSFILYKIGYYNVKSLILKFKFYFLSLPRELVFYSTLDYKAFVKNTGCGS